MRKAKLERQVDSFINNELLAMGAGDPNGLPGTKGSQNGR